MKAEVKDMCPANQDKAQNTAIAELSRVFATPSWLPRTWQALRFSLLQSTRDCAGIHVFSKQPA